MVGRDRYLLTLERSTNPLDNKSSTQHSKAISPSMLHAAGQARASPPAWPACVNADPGILSWFVFTQRHHKGEIRCLEFGARRVNSCRKLAARWVYD